MRLLEQMRRGRRTGSKSRPQFQRVRKAVFPVAGLGTHFLPATKAMPKELLPIVDRPLIQYAVDEALAAGIQELIFVTHRSKRAIEDYFDRALEIERELESKGRHGQLSALRRMAPQHVHIAYARQSAPLGLGHAIWCARHLIGNEPFAVVLSDDLIDSTPPALAELMDRHSACGVSIIGVQPISGGDTSRYGIVQTESGKANSRLLGIVEKQPVDEASSKLGVVGRYIFTPELLRCLDGLLPGADREIQLTDGIARLLMTEPVLTHHIAGRRFDCGRKLGFLEATMAYALRHPDVGREFGTMVSRLARDLPPPRSPAHLKLVSN
jgi:UTP--glucose-1-phosphate uridylyltransferase